MVDCKSAKAKSKIVKQADSASACGTEAYIKTQGGNSVFCVVALRGRTFRDQLNGAQRKGEQSQQQFQRQMDRLKQRLRDQSRSGKP